MARNIIVAKGNYFYNDTVNVGKRMDMITKGLRSVMIKCLNIGLRTVQKFFPPTVFSKQNTVVIAVREYMYV